MNVLRDIPSLAGVQGPLCLAVGVFDGVHRGHQALIQAVHARASEAGGTAVVVTFEPHPMKVLRPHAAPLLLTSTRHKLRLLKSYGVVHTLVIPFTTAFAATTPEAFISQLVASARPLRLIGVGHRWEFGHRRAGNVALLEKLGAQHGFDVLELETVLHDDDVISSTRIRQAVKDGCLNEAAELLGRPFSLFGKVVPGEGLGRKLSFATVNLDVEGEKRPPYGVYAGHCKVGETLFKAAINLGIRPTVDGKREVVEAHLLDFEGDLYGQDLELELMQSLRPEIKFNSLAELSAQISKDVEQVRRLDLGRDKAVCVV